MIPQHRKQLTIYFDLDLAKRFKAICSEQDKSMSAVLRELVELYITTYKKGK